MIFEIESRKTYGDAYLVKASESFNSYLWILSTLFTRVVLPSVFLGFVHPERNSVKKASMSSTITVNCAAASPFGSIVAIPE